jgi:hypothetical protein
VSDNQGVHFYDDARYNVAGDTGAKHTVQVMGANHNFYNTVWTPGMFPAGTADDWGYVTGGSTDGHCGTGAGNKRLTAAQQRGTAWLTCRPSCAPTSAARRSFLPILTGEAPPPASAQTTNLHVSYHAPEPAAKRLDVNRLLTATT